MFGPRVSRYAGLPTRDPLLPIVHQKCLGCVVTHALVAEPTIRLILVACQLSSPLHHQPTYQKVSPPLLGFWQHSLKKALDEDPFWGPDLWRTFESRAKALEKGIEELVKQCLEFGPLATANLAVGDDDSPPVSPGYGFLKAEPQMLPHAEGNWTSSVVMSCWTSLLADAAEANRGGSSRNTRRQSVLVRCSTS